MRLSRIPPADELYAYVDGYFAAIGEADWIELDRDGYTYAFVKKATENGYIILHDESRGMYLRLPEAGGECAWRTGPEWHPLHDVTKVKFSSPRYVHSHGYFERDTEGVWVEVPVDGAK